MQDKISLYLHHDVKERLVENMYDVVLGRWLQGQSAG